MRYFNVAIHLGIVFTLLFFSSFPDIIVRIRLRCLMFIGKTSAVWKT